MLLFGLNVLEKEIFFIVTNLDISTNVATDKKSSFVNSLYTVKFIHPN